MDKYMTISQISRQYQISTRMLRHYEKLGMIESARREDYAYTINFPDFFEWQFLYQWAERNEQYEPAMSPREEKNMGGSLEEHLNWVYATHMGRPGRGIDGKLDLLLPIRRREVSKEKEA